MGALRVERPEQPWGGESWRHPLGRRAVFLGDLVDRGPNVPDTVRIVRNMVTAGTAFCIAGNHDVKFMRWLRGKQVQVKHGLEQSIAEVESLSRRERATGWRRFSMDWSATTSWMAGGWWSPMRGCGRRCTAAARARFASSASTAKPRAKPMSSVCRFATTGRRNIGARRRSSTAIRRCLSPSG